jgi:hypothetical protein
MILFIVAVKSASEPNAFKSGGHGRGVSRGLPYSPNGQPRARLAMFVAMFILMSVRNNIDINNICMHVYAGMYI